MLIFFAPLIYMSELVFCETAYSPSIRNKEKLFFSFEGITIAVLFILSREVCLKNVFSKTHRVGRDANADIVIYLRPLFFLSIYSIWIENVTCWTVLLVYIFAARHKLLFSQKTSLLCKLCRAIFTHGLCIASRGENCQRTDEYIFVIGMTSNLPFLELSLALPFAFIEIQTGKINNVVKRYNSEWECTLHNIAVFRELHNVIYYGGIYLHYIIYACSEVLFILTGVAF